MDEKIQADVPLEPSGGRTASEFGGLLGKICAVLAIECLPRDLPDRITVGYSPQHGDSIHVRDIKLRASDRKVQPESDRVSVVAPC